MLEKDSELSGAVVGGAAGQRGPGEESPIAAAEMERRIGLMGRLHDAAARLRQQPESEVADHDAELWYAACFVCTTSLPGGATGTPPAGQASGNGTSWERPTWWCWPSWWGTPRQSRERLEGTAIPDIDDGLTDARATLLAESHAALDEMAETVTADLREFNQDLPVEIRPAMQGLPAVTERAAALVIGPADFPGRTLRGVGLSQLAMFQQM